MRINMNFELIKATKEDKEVLYKLLQFALYDANQYIDNELNSSGEFEYKWFNNYFTDNNRDAYLIKNDNTIIGFVFVNEFLQFTKSGKSIAEFLILPKYRRYHIGKKVAYQLFDKYPGNWEVEPMENNEIAYKFWENIINEYTDNNYELINHEKSSIFIFKSKILIKNKDNPILE